MSTEYPPNRLYNDAEHHCLEMLIRRLTQANENLQRLYDLNGNNSAEDWAQNHLKSEDAEILFVVRIAQASQWAKELLKLRKGSEHQVFRSELSEFQEHVKEITRLRDFHAHEEEYASGRGKHRKDFEKPSILPFFDGNGLSRVSFQNCDITQGNQTIGLKNVVLLAGRVDPKDVLTELAPTVQKLIERLQLARVERQNDKD